MAWSNFKPGSFDISMNHDIWLSRHKQIVTAWTRQCLHYGNTVTSRTDSPHSALKTALRLSIHDPKDVVDAFSTVLKEQQCSYQHRVENERTVTQHRHRGMLFASVNGFISQFAFDKVQEHMTLFNLTARSSLPACSGTFGKSMGLPCAHIIKERSWEGTSLTVDDFSAHWNIRPVDYRLLIQDLEQVITRSRLQNALTNRSTKRLPSHFEAIDDDISTGLDAAW